MNVIRWLSRKLIRPFEPCSGRGICCVVALAGVLAAVPAGAEETAAEKVRFFEAKIRPVLAEKCYGCHSPSNKIKGDLRLDTKDGILRGGEHGPAVIPGDPEKSPLIKAIRYEDPDLSMPPKDKGGKLPDAVIADFERWVRMGAPDPRTGGPSQRVARELSQEARTWWSFQPVQAPPVPQVKDSAWPRTDIDRFILASLEEKQLKPAADADRYLLLRRVHFALTGLPPTPAQIDAFATTDDPRALERVVDELLATRQYGERWGRHWLDVARYAETNGRDVNGIQSEAWRYRDYVIESFQEDKPFDRFILEQIAGNLLPDTGVAERARNLVATGFLAIGPKSLLETNSTQFAVDLADEQIDAVSRGFLGLTIACARCHEHRADPVTQEDYTALAGIFLSSETRFGTPGGAQGRMGTAFIEAPDSLGLPMIERRIEPEKLAQLTAEHTAIMKTFFETMATSGDGAPRQGMMTKDGTVLEELLFRARAIEVDIRAFRPNGALKPRLMGVIEKPPAGAPPAPPHSFAFAPQLAFRTVGDSPLFARGQIAREQDPVARGVPLFLNGGRNIAIPANSSGRLELARWIASPANPLTARVFVNRAWHWLFGRGLVASVDDFGRTGSAPSHAALLDHLATRFVAEGWSVKKLVREIVLSRAWQLARADGPGGAPAEAAASLIDPDNVMLRRANVRSLDAESLRDAMLAASGTLDLTPRRGSLLAMTGQGPIDGLRFPVLKAEAVTTAEGDFRSIYLPVARDLPHSTLAIFNSADASAVVGARETTIVPAQALFLMNSGFVARQSSLLARRVCAAGTGFDARFRLACMLVLGRPPRAEEAEAARQFIQSRESTDETAAWTGLCRALFGSAEFRFL